MDQIWAPTGAMVCLHPGQAPLHGRAEIMASWRAILRHPPGAQGALHRRMGDRPPGLAIVVCREILPEGQLMATNTFARLSEGWRMIGHHSGPVPPIETAQTAARSAPTRDRRKLHFQADRGPPGPPQ